MKSLPELQNLISSSDSHAVTQKRSEELSEEAYESSIGVCAGLGGEFQVGEGYCLASLALLHVLQIDCHA